MKIVRCRSREGVRYGIVTQNRVELLEGEPYGGDHAISGEVPLSDVTLLAPCEPGKIIAVGINYAPHAKELEFDIPKEPLIFLKPTSAVIGPDEAIVLPAMSEQVEYEGELAAVIGRHARNLSEDEALSVVFGYTCINDVTARDLQKRDVQFTRSKSFDTFAPIGPWIETELDPSNLAIETRLNDEVKQTSKTGRMIRTVQSLVSFISQIMTLHPGDVIATGTPAGVGRLAAGDTVSVIIENIGTLTNKVVNYDQN